MSEYPIILFDGVCNYCNGMVNTIIKYDVKKRIRYSALQSNYTKKLFNDNKNDKSIDSIVFVEKNRLYFYSDAVLRICKILPFPFKLLYAFIVIPKFIRDYIYKIIAKNRYKWFGKREQCVIPSKEVKKLFLH